ncbi:helix-turn-helix transcriptional regulator [Nocardia lijiangensis]|uniref:helix-turn-helix transcriptional regulator n=1 Tax=Nocardia lijiangensis TaxID=299618 RepID=UPI00083384D2|nr:helix-turn-helix transcriptional regulator [Nocardia lijiangensis]
MDRAELAAVLRTARARVEPADVGLPVGSRRQVPGLRREEVAQLAGVSVDYVVRLEQGRGPKPSTQVLNALTRALRLGDDDRNLVFRLAGAEPPRAGRVPMLVRPSVLRILDRMSDLPALVLSAKSDVLAWNPLAETLLGDFSARGSARHNLLRERFLGERLGRVRLSEEDEDRTAAHCVGCLRTAQARYPGDTDLAHLIAELRSGSARFDDLWRAGYSSTVSATTLTIEHPVFGSLTLDCDILQVPDADQTVVVYSAAPGTPEATTLDLLRVTGAEQFAR